MDSSSADQTQGFWHAYVSNPKSLLMLVVVCCVIAFITNLLNQLGMITNIGFSFCFGFPISMIETFLRTRRQPLPDWAINLISLVVGSLFGTSCIYGYIVYVGIVPFGFFGRLFFVNLGVAFAFSAAAFYFFWFRYRNQTLTLALRDQQLKAAELENLKQQAENRLLQSQMEPHFLFNTLANIQSLIDIDPTLAKGMVADLSHMLRASLKNSSQDQCSIDQELALVRAYLAIQQVRIGDRLQVIESIDTAVLPVSIPPMIIQPVIENAIKHGVEKSVGTSTIQLSIQQHGNALEIDVTDNCASKHTTQSGLGISLKNIRQRLDNRYGDAARLNSEATEHGWRTLIEIPLPDKQEAQ
ncbi:sensor histidine kinase [Reinekea sp. G2M2-21]|uniref:sensor histidine kinase n=1 Tax=Reinekea sp. G2M2-21 TaxID=2788942 RepID=UPI0018A94012|nr:histidine kinase [Reinekea sp. G2M2-21]